jgi:UDP-3-O-acyl N-acetylglucosamine deacetylase
LIRQCTLGSSAVMRGCGLHTGEDCEIRLSPADEGSGIIFEAGGTEIRAHVSNVRDLHRGTTLGVGDTEVHTVEHLLAALAGMGVDNVRIRVEGPEIPAADGSALPFVELIKTAGILEQKAEAVPIMLHEPVWIIDRYKYLLAAPGTGLSIKALISFPHLMIGEQAISLRIDPEAFKKDIAPARTFCTADEIEFILSQGLGKGGTEDNVIVVHEDCYSVPLRFNDEFVRHKVLDLIGDLSLIGWRLCADVTAIKSSHALNAGLASKISRLHTSGQQGG